MTRMHGALAVAIIPKPAFDEWVKYLLDFIEVSLPKNPPNKPEKFEVDYLFVFPIQVNAEACRQFVKNHYKEIFEAILTTWDSDKRLWPKDLSYEQFEKYFAYVFHSAVYDLTQT